MREAAGSSAIPARPAVWLAGIVLAYLFVAAQYAARTPAWQVPDEPAHFNYVRHIVENGSLPVLRPGDYDQAYNEQFADPDNTLHLSIDPLRYESWQPPLYYLIAAPVFAATGGNLFALRLLSVALGAGAIVAAYLVAREIYPRTLALALGTAAFVAFVPQHVAMLAGINNDSLAELLIALTLWQLFRAIRRETTGALLGVGILLGLGLLTKGTNYLMVPVVLVGLIAPLVRRGAPVGQYARSLALVGSPAIALGALWWLRNAGVYDGLDVLGLANHNRVVVGQPLTVDWIARLGIGPFLMSGLSTTFHSFWGQFGWMGVPMPDPFYLVLGALCLVALVGWLLWLRSPRPPAAVPLAGGLLALLVILTAGYYIFYNFTFVQHQGRYLFPALIPIGLTFSIGIDYWTRRLSPSIGPFLYAGVFAGLAALDLWALHRFVIPALSA